MTRVEGSGVQPTSGTFSPAPVPTRPLTCDECRYYAATGGSGGPWKHVCYREPEPHVRLDGWRKEAPPACMYGVNVAK